MKFRMLSRDLGTASCHALHPLHPMVPRYCDDARQPVEPTATSTILNDPNERVLSNGRICKYKNGQDRYL
jgi:hypothetical protein